MWEVERKGETNGEWEKFDKQDNWDYLIRRKKTEGWINK